MKSHLLSLLLSPLHFTALEQSINFFTLCSVGEVCAVRESCAGLLDIPSLQTISLRAMASNVINNPGLDELDTRGCVSEVKVSSQYDSDHGADKLTDGNDGTCWQTPDGTPPPHWIRIWMRQCVSVRHISVMVGQGYPSHLPLVMSLWGGRDTGNDMRLVNTVRVTEDEADDQQWVNLLDDTVNVTPEQRGWNVWRVQVTEVHREGGRCEMWGLRVTGDNVRQVPPPPSVDQLSVRMGKIESRISGVQNAMESSVANVENTMESRVSNVENAMESRVANVENAVSNVENAMESRVASLENAIVTFVHKVSEMSGAEGLKQACSGLFQDNVTVTAENYVKLYHTALNLPSGTLQTNVEKFVLHNLKDCLESSSVVHLSLESFLHLFSTDNLRNLDAADEVVLYEAIVRWVKAESFHEEIRARREERLTCLEKLMHLVKFINIDKDYLTHHVRNEGIVRSNEGVMREVEKFLPGRR